MAICARWELICNDSVIAAEPRWSGEGTIVGCSAFKDPFILCIDGPLDCYTNRGDAGVWYVFDTGWEEWESPAVVHLFIKGFF